ncbi:UDP-N-acetylmuramyl peptide synthase [Legionella drozanskii]|uniref:UDP-N-acetylmuramyl tripeptide synthase n=1 Tax=Legionella drozanskii LLAP-1 TaxID=1212489 RepID=A0A0W0SXZ9_9GAMM|nr:UDP-N-acetylmuramyl peptide synthase [Legionella drozanskii]KTC88240.1 UDP-N-acetylmuramyl tripeptide synthase [Legionella drozanskii LLAP-1]
MNNEPMNKNARCYYESAKKMLFPVEEVSEVEGFKLKLWKRNLYFCGSGTPFNDSSSIHLARNKHTMNKLLERAGFPVPKATFIHSSEYEYGMLEEKIADLSFPLVAKPQTGKLGQNVLCNIQTLEQLKNYIAKNIVESEYISIEEFHANFNAYRVLIFNYRILGVIQRYPAQVIGDGQHPLQALIDLSNTQRLKLNNTLGPIIVDEECQIKLAELGIDLSYVPKKDEVVSLCYACNATRGGTYKSLSKKIVRENSQLLIRAARELNLNLVGFDVQCADINVPIEQSRGVIIEANDGPSIRIHEYPLEGDAVSVSKKIIRTLIYRYPFSYLYVLYNNRRSAPYLRGLIFLGLIVLMFLNM